MRIAYAIPARFFSGVPSPLAAIVALVPPMNSYAARQKDLRIKLFCAAYNLTCRTTLTGSILRKSSKTESLRGESISITARASPPLASLPR